jgi:hypothetical protein
MPRRGVEFVPLVGQLPRTDMEPDAAVSLLEDLADRALGSEFGPVICLEAPEAVQVPCSPRRADGGSK